MSCGSSKCCILHDLSLLMLVEDAIGDHRGMLQSRSHNGFIGSHECLLLFTPSCCSECFYDL